MSGVKYSALDKDCLAAGNEAHHRYPLLIQYKGLDRGTLHVLVSYLCQDDVTQDWPMERSKI